jgi:hypothetical protein
MVKKGFSVDFPKGWFMSWTATTQAAYATTITLSDSVKQYFSGTRASTEISPPLSQGSAYIEGNALVLEISVNNTSTLKSYVTLNGIVSDIGDEVGRQFSVFTEDMSANGGDYNDAHVCITAWKYKA